MIGNKAEAGHGDPVATGIKNREAAFEQLWQRQFVGPFNKKFPTLPLYDTESAKHYVRRAVRFLLTGSVDGPFEAEREAEVGNQNQAELGDAAQPSAVPRVESKATIALGADLWQPIGSAPKNGKVILGFCDKRICAQGVVKAMWSSRKGFWASPDGAEGYDLTHWMPLPAPPAQTSSPLPDESSGQHGSKHNPDCDWSTLFWEPVRGSSK